MQVAEAEEKTARALLLTIDFKGYDYIALRVSDAMVVLS